MHPPSLQVEAAIEKRSTEERKGLELSGKRDEDLFFVDKVCPAPRSSTHAREPLGLSHGWTLTRGQAEKGAGGRGADVSRS